MTTLAATGIALVVAVLAAGNASIRGSIEDQQAQTAPKRQPATKRAQPTAAERAHMAKLTERHRAWLERTSAELRLAVDNERKQFLRHRAAELEARNKQTRAEIARHLEAARRDSRRLEIEAEAAKLLRQSKSAPPSERAQIERRAAELIDELGRLKAAPAAIRKE